MDIVCVCSCTFMSSLCFALSRPQVICCCPGCEKLLVSLRRMTPSKWEEHCGLKSFNNWKKSIKMCAGPDIPGAPNVSI